MSAVVAGVDAGTKLAVERTRLAHERTLMAWVRTGTSLISFGFTVYKFFQYVREAQPGGSTGPIGPRGFALTMILVGLGALLMGTIEHRMSMQVLRREYGKALIPRSIAAVTACFVAGLGVLGIIAVALRL